MKGILVYVFLILICGDAHGLCVSTSRAKLRSGPSSKFKVSWVVARYTPLVEIGRQGSWYRVKDMDGQKHWVYSGLVSKRTKCAAVRVPSANIRTGPGTKYPLASMVVADKYTSMLRIKRQGDWFYMKDFLGYKFWIHKNMLWRPLKSIQFSF